MSYNCHAEYLGDGRLRIRKSDLKKLAKRYDEYQGLAEINFVVERDECIEPSDAADELIIQKLWWSGEGSGSCFDTLKDKVLTLTTGSAEILFTWEDGDSHSGLIVNDGKVTEAEVVFALKPVTKAA